MEAASQKALVKASAAACKKKRRRRRGRRERPRRPLRLSGKGHLNGKLKGRMIVLLRKEQSLLATNSPKSRRFLTQVMELTKA